MEAPEELASDVVLTDGSLVRVSPVTAKDKDAMLRFLEGLSAETLELRFNAAPGDRTRFLQWMMPSPESFGLLVWHQGGVVAHASYYRINPETAEPGIIIAEPFWGKGLATILLGQLSEEADDAGIKTFEHQINPDNQRMLTVIHDLGFPTHMEYRAGFVQVSQPTSLSEEVIETFIRREAHANAAAARGFLQPRSIALVGASREPGSIGYELFHNLISAGFPGPVYPVNPSAAVVQSVPAYPSVLACPGPVDLAILSVPAAVVNAVAEECGKKGVRSLLVISAGFGEAGEKGRELQGSLVEICRRYGMRLVGPNCMGLANTSPQVNLNGQFSPRVPARGTLGFLSQSGAVGLALINFANYMGLGMSSFISVGNKADLSANDFLNYWETDEDTHEILLYLESFGNPRKFSRIAKRLSRTKPIIAVKGGRSSAGFRATQSHTGALLAASDVTVDALFHDCGVIRTDTLEELFDVAAFLQGQGIPKGRRVGIITNAGGAGILAADACENLGLAVPELAPTSQQALRGFLRPDASLRNPVDMVASATLDNYRNVMRVVAQDPNIDVQIVIFIPPLTLRPQEVGQVILAEAGNFAGKPPVAAVLMSPEMPSLLKEGKVLVPCYHFPESAARAIAKVAEYGAWLARPAETPPILTGSERTRAAALVGASLAGGGGWLSQEKVQELLRCCGISTVPSRIVPTPEAAGAAAEELGGTVVLKGIAPGLLHKRDVGAVMLGLKGASEVRQAAQAMSSRLVAPGTTPTGFLLQPQIEDGIEMLVGVTHDVQFGPVVACGAGGTMVELVKDVAVRLAPLTRSDATEMVRSLRTYPLLQGYRGGARHDIAALEDLLLLIGRMADALHGVVEMDLNPVIVLPEGKGLAIVDARIRTGPVTPDIPLGAKKR